MQTEKIIIDLEDYVEMNFRGPLAGIQYQNLQDKLDKGSIPTELVERATNVLARFKKIGVDSSFLGGTALLR